MEIRYVRCKGACALEIRNGGVVVARCRLHFSESRPMQRDARLGRGRAFEAGECSADIAVGEMRFTRCTPVRRHGIWWTVTTASASRIEVLPFHPFGRLPCPRG